MTTATENETAQDRVEDKAEQAKEDTKDWSRKELDKLTGNKGQPSFGLDGKAWENLTEATRSLQQSYLEWVQAWTKVLTGGQEVSFPSFGGSNGHGHKG